MNTAPPDPRLVTIDGASRSGKTTLGLRIADRLGWDYLESGFAYRAVATRANDLSDGASAEDLATGLALHSRAPGADGQPTRVSLKGHDLPADALLAPAVDAQVVALAARPDVRREATVLCRAAVGSRPTVVGGRDAGRLIFPDADLKLVLTASIEELDQRGVLSGSASRARLEQALLKEHLTPASDAVIIETTDRSPEEVEAEVIDLLERFGWLRRSRT